MENSNERSVMQITNFLHKNCGLGNSIMMLSLIFFKEHENFLTVKLLWSHFKTITFSLTQIIMDGHWLMVAVQLALFIWLPHINKITAQPACDGFCIH